MPRILSLIALVLAANWSTWSHATDMPTGVANPDKAILDPMYSDPVLFWRVMSVPKDIYEPESYFYWPVEVVRGAPQPMKKATRKTTIPKASLDKAADWAAARKSNALVVIHRGVIQLEQYWNGADAKTIANGRAITRSITPLLLGFAVADGKVKLDDPIGRHISEWADDRRGQITVRQLAQHVSGLEVAPTLPVTQIFGNKDLCLAYCGDVVRAALNYDYSTPPGTRFEVAQENTQILAIVIERAMGISISALLSERVWRPIGAAVRLFNLIAQAALRE